MSEFVRNVPKLKIRYAGKTIPAEKFAITQSEKYFSQNQMLLLPALVSIKDYMGFQTSIHLLFNFKEFLYIWNIFATIGNSPKILNPILERVEKALTKHKDDKSESNSYHYIRIRKNSYNFEQ